jgi:chromosome partitioning protein
VIITVVSNKGGVGKSTCALHLAHYLADNGPTALFDGDPNRSVLNWDERTPEGFRHKNLKVAQIMMVNKIAKSVDHSVVDTTARPAISDYKDLAAGSDILLVPVNPDIMSLETALETVRTLREVNAENVAVVLTKVAHTQRSAADAVREECRRAGVRVLARDMRWFAAYQHAARLGVSVREVVKLEPQRDNTAEAWSDVVAIGKEMFAMAALTAVA